MQEKEKGVKEGEKWQELKIPESIKRISIPEDRSSEDKSTTKSDYKLAKEGILNALYEWLDCCETTVGLDNGSSLYTLEKSVRLLEELLPFFGRESTEQAFIRHSIQDLVEIREYLEWKISKDESIDFESKPSREIKSRVREIRLGIRRLAAGEGPLKDAAYDEGVYREGPGPGLSETTESLKKKALERGEVFKKKWLDRSSNAKK